MTGPTKTFEIYNCKAEASFVLAIDKRGRYVINGEPLLPWANRCLDGIIFSDMPDRVTVFSYFLDGSKGVDTMLYDCKRVVRWVRKNFTYK